MRVASILFQILLNRASKRELLVPRATLSSVLRNTLSIIAKYHADATESPDFLIEPLKGEIKALHFRKVEEGYHLGRTAALRIIEGIVKKVHG